MKKFPIGIQLYSVRDVLKADFEGTLKQIKEMGYDGVEFAGLYGHSPKEVKKMCNELGLVPISAHVSMDELERDSEQLFADYAEIGVMQIAIPSLKKGTRPGEEGFASTVETIKKYGMIAKEHGMILAYHNHDFEFEKLDGELKLDILYREVPPELLQTQIDTCWAKVGGTDPAEYVRKYKDRAPTVHIKDFVGVKSNHMYQLIGVDAGEQKASDESAEFHLCPVGYGKQDVPSILKASEDAGAKWVIVEQDQPLSDKTTVECAKMSIDYLRTIIK